MANDTPPPPAARPLPPLPELPTDIDVLLRDCADFVEASLRGDDDHDIEWVRDLARRLAAVRGAR